MLVVGVSATTSWPAKLNYTELCFCLVLFWMLYLADRAAATSLWHLECHFAQARGVEDYELEAVYIVEIKRGLEAGPWDMLTGMILLPFRSIFTRLANVPIAENAVPIPTVNLCSGGLMPHLPAQASPIPMIAGIPGVVKYVVAHSEKLGEVTGEGSPSVSIVHCAGERALANSLGVECVVGHELEALRSAWECKYIEYSTLQNEVLEYSQHTRELEEGEGREKTQAPSTHTTHPPSSSRCYARHSAAPYPVCFAHPHPALVASAQVERTATIRPGPHTPISLRVVTTYTPFPLHLRLASPRLDDHSHGTLQLSIANDTSSQFPTPPSPAQRSWWDVARRTLVASRRSSRPLRILVAPS
ncbi:hypothetical protein DFP72DRAFT_1048568 [Ephemerocybe angulata]|uniref:Uncharacterized protein n=1 Tax=Ephemerocybe angulata TaxID=980116 RepID=A0A8H6HQK3_9AGAR|nr:hypothetical protein DFP72DRAFT_1048568 [Tulosesus angulatus]